MANLERILLEYRSYVEISEFHTPKTKTDIDEFIKNYWKEHNLPNFEDFGLCTADVFDQMYLEFKNLYDPDDVQKSIIHEWHREHSDTLLQMGIYSYDRIDELTDRLTHAYLFETSQKVESLIREIAHIPMMTQDVLQEIIYAACRPLNPASIVWFDKFSLKIPKVG